MMVDIQDNQLSENDFECLQGLYLKAKSKLCRVLEIFKYKDFNGELIIGLRVLPYDAEDSSAAFIMRNKDEN